ncbi:phosphoglycolate phosphatase [Paracoccus fontiphilus]|nr:phosphoglycolate phosphatase [Paracoccus fontiphilus]
MLDKVENCMNVCLAPCPVVFDLDGTLINSAPDIHGCVNAVLGQHGTPLLTLDQVRSFIGGGVDVLWQKIIAARELEDAKKPDYIAAFMTCYQDATQLTHLFPGVEDALQTLADRGHPLGICTNKPLAVTRAILAHFGILDLFGCVIGGDSVPERKPHPAPLRAALQGLGADPRQPRALYVGDSEFDAACAAAVPMPFLIYTEGYRQTPVGELPHLAPFDDFARLPALVEMQTAA